MTRRARESVIRIAHVDDHETVQLGLTALVAGEPDLEVAISAFTVDEILDRLDGIDLVVLDLRLSDGSSPSSNIAALHDRHARVLAFTGADDPLTLRAASRAGVLGILRKSESRQAILEAMRRAARGMSVASTEWAAALDSDPELASAGLSPKERQVLAMYASGEKSQTVASRTGLSTNTVSEYVRRITAQVRDGGQARAHQGRPVQARGRRRRPSRARAMTPGRSSPKAESSVLRVVVAVFGVASVVFFVLSLGSIVADTAHLHVGWSIAAAVVVFLPPPILAAFRLLLPTRVLRTLLGAYAVAFTLVIAALPLMMTGTAVPADREPWPFTVAALGTLASAVAWRPPLAWTHLVVTCLAILPARYAMSPGSDLAPTVEDAVFTLSFASIFTALTLAALSNARALDTEMVKARVTASRAATTHAREREQARLDALVHDEVIATLYYASLGKPELAASVRKQAGNALANLARLREPDDGSEPAPPPSSSVGCAPW